MRTANSTYDVDGLEFRAMKASERIDGRSQLTNQLWRCGVTASLSLIVVVTLTGVMVMAPVGGGLAVFLAFLVLLGSSLFLVSLFSFIAPVVELVACHTLQSIQDEFDQCALGEEVVSRNEFLKELVKAVDPALFLREHQAEIARFLDSPIPEHKSANSHS